jgi:hypothetical protein
MSSLVKTLCRWYSTVRGLMNSWAAIGYLIGGGVMIIGGLVEVFLGIDAEASRWSRSHDRSPRSAPGRTRHDWAGGRIRIS